jgi:hypothetical protein
MSFIRYSVIASFIFGLLAGAAIINLVCGTHLDNAELEIERLNALLAEQTEQIAALERTIAQQEEFTVTEIEVHVLFKDEKENDELSSLEIEKRVKELLKNIRGREVSTLDPILIVNIVDGRPIQVSNTEYILTVKSLLISEKLVMHVEAAEKVEQVSSAPPAGQ